MQPKNNTPDIAALTAKWKPEYDKLGSIWCKALRENVLFTQVGWKHFRFDGNGKRRSPIVIELRYNLIPVVPVIVKNAQKVLVNTIPTPKYGQGTYYAFYELPFKLNSGKYVSVILRKVNSSKLHYYSLRFTSNKTKKALQRA